MVVGDQLHLEVMPKEVVAISVQEEMVPWVQPKAEQQEAYELHSTDIGVAQSPMGC